MPEPDQQTRETIERMYERFNERRIEALLALMHEDVDWTNALEGGRVNGRDAVRDYWQRQFTVIDPTVEPLEITEREDGDIEVRVQQTVRDMNGDLLGQGEVLHTYRFERGLIQRMDVVALDDLNAPK